MFSPLDMPGSGLRSSRQHEHGLLNQPLRQRARETLNQLRRELLEERTADGHWEGQLSASALSTATAVSAMSAILIHQDPTSQDRAELRQGIARGIGYLRQCQNDDGGFGDTDRSHSNIATSYLVLAASSLAARAVHKALSPEQLDRLNRYIQSRGGMDALRRRYGKDKTFVVPILTNLAIAGVVSWAQVPALPFEAAVFPQSMYRLLRMPVVSYAIPALVAIGQARHFHGPKTWWPLRWIRAASVGRTIKVLRKMQPDSGGYLEATPLTSFVVMSLAATGRGDHEVSRAGLRFLIDSTSEDGSWPIDTNLATWVTSLAIHALAIDPEDDGCWCTPSLVQWHLGCQHRIRHPFTGAQPGGWGWSDLSGAVPDSDDTPAAIIALRDAMRWMDDDLRRRCQRAIDQGIGWLRRLQNRDGGWPTFCRGWGKLPFDRSSNDLTAHALRALGDHKRNRRQVTRAVDFLVAGQQDDGAWLPLWFGNQDHADESNPVYGTSRVLATAGLGLLPQQAIRRGCEFMIAAQNADGGWGGGNSLADWLARTPVQGAESEEPALIRPRQDKGLGRVGPPIVSSVEETSLAVDALANVLLAQRARNPLAADGVSLASNQGHGPSEGDECPEIERLDREAKRFNPPFLPPDRASGGNEASCVAIIRGVEFLLASVHDQRHRVPWPIGFYFAKLWYHERLYPLIFATTALAKYLRATADPPHHDWPR